MDWAKLNSYQIISPMRNHKPFCNLFNLLIVVQIVTYTHVHSRSDVTSEMLTKSGFSANWWHNFEMLVASKHRPDLYCDSLSALIQRASQVGTVWVKVKIWSMFISYKLYMEPLMNPKKSLECTIKISWQDSHRAW